MLAHKDGELKIALVKAKSYLQPIDTTAYFKFEIWGKEGRRDTTISAKAIFGEPMEGSLHLRDKNSWFVYGKGPFQYLSGLDTPKSGKDATVQLNYGFTDNDEVIKITSKNYGNYPTITASTSDWGWFYVDKRNVFLEKSRSFFKLDVSGFDFPVDFINSSKLEFLGSGNHVDPDGKDGYKFVIQEVSEPWGEHTVTWGNQPSVAGTKFVLQNPPGSSGNAYKVYSLDVKDMTIRWIEEASENFGLRLKLWDEEKIIVHHVKHITTPGSDYGPISYSPELTIDFSNPDYLPEDWALNVGSVEKGDTVLVSYHNGSANRNSATTWRRQSFKIDGDTIEGKRFTFEDSNRRSEKPLYQNSVEYMRPFIYVGSKKRDEVMLGQTKYYAAKWKDPAKKDEITIEEVQTDGRGEPATPSGLISGAFSGNPIEELSGGKSGVYWERKWATINNDGTISTGSLPSGMIRVVGRYWEKGKDYKVNLKADAAGGNGELEIKVIKPARLGDQYDKARDVFDEVINVDSLIIANAGKYGIPPQLIKAHISVEAAKKDFGGSVGKGFAPSYRYEPYTTQNDRYLKDWSGKFFFEDSSSTAFSDVPKHSHVEDRNYYTTVKSVWDIIKEESQLLSNSGGKSYGKRNANGKMDFGKYTTIQSKYNSIYEKVIEDTTKTLTQLADSTNKLMAKYLRDEWKPKYRSVVGAKNMIAQTRAASSYGLLQMLYTTALDEADYKKSKIPEKMNEKEFFEGFLIYQRKLFNGRISKNNESEFNWSEGYELLLRNSIFKIWNSDPDYPKAVLKETFNYKPSNN